MSDTPPASGGKARSQLCAEISGFLFKHPCGMIARWNCTLCQKPICNQHAKIQNNGKICLACAHGRTNQDRADHDWHDPLYWSDIEVDVFDEPMWISRRRRRKLDAKRRKEMMQDEDVVDHAEPGDDGLQFNDADEAVFNEGQAENDWETDMGAS